MIFQLSCAHIYHLTGWPQETMWCSAHSSTFLVAAVECREWKLKCNRCRFGRWCGQGQDIALTHSAKHTQNCRGPVNIDYLMHPDSFSRLRSLFSTKVQPRIASEDPMYLWSPPDNCSDCYKPADKCKCIPF